MSKSDKIKLNLFDLKPKAELLSVLKFFQENLSTWFDHSGAPLGQFLKLERAHFAAVATVTPL